MLRRGSAFVLFCLVLTAGTAYAAAPNDPGWIDQWHLRTIHADRAWTRSKGSGVIVAVVDTGVDLNHPDLRGRLVKGTDLIANDGDPMDEDGHGTFMAGLIAAATGNAEGVASVAPLAKIMPIRALGADGTGDPDVVADGITWAINHGADVINLSLAQEAIGGSGQSSGNLYEGQKMDRAINAASRAGIVVVTAAGNNFETGGSPSTAYNARAAGVLVVGASTRANRRAAYSNYGSGLDVLAPGGGSATNPSKSSCQSNSPVFSTWWRKDTQESAYGKGCGTSMAVAHVSGVAALLMARGYSNISTVSRIKGTAVHLSIPGLEQGAGRVDAAAAVGATSVSHSKPKPKAPSPATKRPRTVGAAGAKPSVEGTKIARTPSAEPSTITGLALASSRPYSAPQDPRLQLVALALALSVGVAVSNTIARRFYATH